MLNLATLKGDGDQSLAPGERTAHIYHLEFYKDYFSPFSQLSSTYLSSIYLSIILWLFTLHVGLQSGTSFLFFCTQFILALTTENLKYLPQIFDTQINKYH
jgi:hypothetical protein